MNSEVRLLKITISNLKNISNGIIEFACNKKENVFESVDILGIYGQNGSGKTTLIQAVSLLKTLLTGRPIPEYYADIIQIGHEEARVDYEIYIQNINIQYKVLYSVLLCKAVIKEDNLNVENLIEEKKYKVFIKNETINVFNCKAKEATKMHPIIRCDADSNLVFTPKSKLDTFCNYDKESIIELMASKKIAQEKSQSFIFSKQTIKIFEDKCKNNEYISILKSLLFYGNFNLFVISTRDIGLINLNLAIPFSFKLTDGNILKIGNINISLDRSSIIPKDAFQTVKASIDNINIVLSQLIPGLQVDLVESGNKILSDGSMGYTVELVSLRNEKKIPLSYESEGIKKIISILQMLIVMFNSKGITVAIDELDAGVFEYLLGEILKIIEESGKGQLIFTSHNLRPLEVIDKKFIYFTTTNPNNRFIKMKNIGSNNNLRDVYFHDIILGGQKEKIYDTTNNFDISLAFKKAGDYSAK